jgi:hypothetical protein
LANLIDRVFIRYDSDNNYILIPKFLVWNPIDNPKHEAGAAKLVSGLPIAPIMGDFLKALKALPKPYPNLTDTVSKRYQYGINTVSIQEEEKEEEKEKETEEGEGEAAPPPSIAPPEVKNLYDRTCLSLPKWKAITDSRADKLRVRIKEHPDIQWWADLFRKAEATPFCKGVNDRGWKANLDWLIENDSNALKVLEGKYDGERPDKDFADRSFQNTHEYDGKFGKDGFMPGMKTGVFDLKDV